VIDFEFAAFDWRVQEMAVALTKLRFGHISNCLTSHFEGMLQLKESTERK
jgi:Ser/Thr protein kinase RdoA (MazF antagonist)